MIFKEAYLRMLEGCKIKRPCFKGYWYIDGVNGKLTIKLQTGQEITEGSLDLTVKNCLAEDWEVVIEEPKVRSVNKLDKIFDISPDKYITLVEGNESTGNLNPFATSDRIE